MHFLSGKKPYNYSNTFPYRTPYGPEAIQLPRITRNQTMFKPFFPKNKRKFP